MSRDPERKWPGFIVWPIAFVVSLGLWVLIGMAAHEIFTH